MIAKLKKERQELLRQSKRLLRRARMIAKVIGAINKIGLHGVGPKKRRKLSAAVRRRMSTAAKKRWAERKKAEKKS